MPSCTNCGGDWKAGAFNADGMECGGGTQARDRPRCGGRRGTR